MVIYLVKTWLFADIGKTVQAAFTQKEHAESYAEDLLKDSTISNYKYEIQPINLFNNDVVRRKNETDEKKDI